MLHVLVNNKLVVADKACLHINDLAIQRGYGIFDFFKTINGNPVFLDDHLVRLYYSAEQMRISMPYGKNEFINVLQTLMDKNNLLNSAIKIILTGGYSTDGYERGEPNLIVTQSPLIVKSTTPGGGIKLITYRHQRQMPHIKTTDYLMAIWLQPLIKQQNADDVLYEMDGIITECPRANFFIVTKEGLIVTPQHNILKGIIRKQVLKHFLNEFKIVEQDITLNDVYNASEAFITSSTKNILPVLSVNNKVIGNGKPGITTLKLADQLNQIIYAA